LKTTFAEPAQFTSHMPDFYKVLDQQLLKPCWFYLSASPYNLYPFLHKFLDDYYPKGTMILRDASWQTLGGLLGSLTQGVKAYKSSRIDKIHEWLPDRKFICIGDSTQMDPETYAAMYKKYPGWISAIYIRKVLDAPYMEKKNKPERFENAFEGIPANVWKLFVLPDELVGHISTIADDAKLGVMENFACYSCGQQRELQQLEVDKISLE
jgi:phosphatidate phosphatase APP1